MTEAYRAIGLQQAMLVIPVLSMMLAAVLFFASRAMLRHSLLMAETSEVRTNSTASAPSRTAAD